MLNSIKSMIKEKTSFLEAAAIIYEDGSGTNLDNAIVLGEESEPIDPTENIGEDTDAPEKDDHDDDHDNDKEDEKDDNDDSSKDITDEDISDLPINDEPQTQDAPEGDDLLDGKIDGTDQPLSLPGDDLPTPVGAQTGEPINPDDDILNTEIDLGSNTIKDVLPVPPANAGEAIADSDSINQHVDSGFGGDSDGQEPTPAAIEPEANVSEPGNEEADPIGDTFGESTKEKSAEFSLYGVTFTVPDRVTRFIDRHCKEKLTDEIAEKARNAMLDMVNSSKKLKAIEKAILEEQRQIGADSDTDEIRIEVIKKYLAKAHVGKFMCTPNGKYAVLNIDMKYIKGVENGWLEHELWITSKGEAISYDAVESYKESVDVAMESVDPISAFMNGYGLYSEAITLGDDPAPAAEGEAPKEDAAAPAATEEPADEAPPAEGESEVTAAVRDKVSEVDTPAPGGEADGKEALLKKLGSITKSLEDAKKAVMNTIQ